MARSFIARILCLSAWLLGVSGCASSNDFQCKPGDNTIALCQLGSHEECETRDDGCERCTCVPDRPDDIDHGPAAPN